MTLKIKTNKIKDLLKSNDARETTETLINYFNSNVAKSRTKFNKYITLASKFNNTGRSGSSLTQLVINGQEYILKYIKLTVPMEKIFQYEKTHEKNSINGNGRSNNTIILNNMLFEIFAYSLFPKYTVKLFDFGITEKEIFIVIEKVKYNDVINNLNQIIKYNMQFMKKTDIDVYNDVDIKQNDKKNTRKTNKLSNKQQIKNTKKTYKNTNMKNNVFKSRNNINIDANKLDLYNDFIKMHIVKIFKGIEELNKKYNFMHCDLKLENILCKYKKCNIKKYDILREAGFIIDFETYMCDFEKSLFTINGIEYLHNKHNNLIDKIRHKFRKNIMDDHLYKMQKITLHKKTKICNTYNFIDFDKLFLVCGLAYTLKDKYNIDFTDEICKDSNITINKYNMIIKLAKTIKPLLYKHKIGYITTKILYKFCN